MSEHISSVKLYVGIWLALMAGTILTVVVAGIDLGPLNPALIEAVAANAKRFHDADPENHALIPVDLVTASASGLDPDISPAGAEYQAARVARARYMPLARVESLIAAHRQEPLLGIFGEPVVNVLELNLALDRQ